MMLMLTLHGLTCKAGRRGLAAVTLSNMPTSYPA